MSIPPPIRPDFPAVRDSSALPLQLAGAIVAIGNFDGVHRGHQAAIDTAIGHAQRAGRPALALTFEPHPRSFFRPQEPLFRLTPEPVKLRLFAAAGLDGAVVMTFDQALAELSAERFVAEILHARLRVKGVVVGADFRFGRGRLGTAELLKEEGARRGFLVEAIAPVMAKGRPVSSGAVRLALAAGHIPEAVALLGHSWFIEGEVVHGAKRGRELGFPTANIRLEPSCGLQHGIYAVRVYVADRSHDAVASFGRRPQFDNGEAVLEVMLFDFDDDLYGRVLTVEFVDFIRPQQKFASVAVLKGQMERDVEAARAILAQSREQAGKP